MWKMKAAAALVACVLVLALWRFLLVGAVAVFFMWVAWTGRAAFLPTSVWRAIYRMTAGLAPFSRALLWLRMRSALTAAGLSPDGRVPPLRVSFRPTGPIIQVWPAMGQGPDSVVAKGDSLAAAFGFPVTVARGEGETAVVRLRERDPLAAPTPWSAVPECGHDNSGIPVAIDEDGDLVCLADAHTLVVGATGSGKGSAIWSVARSMMPLVDSGLVRFVGLDSKASEVRQAEGLFCRVGYTAEEHADVLGWLSEELHRRGSSVSGREWDPTRETPFLVVVIDEITSLASIFSDSKQRAASFEALRVVLSLGRSRGIMVIGAGQDPTKEALSLRNLFPQLIALRLRDATETSLVLGPAAVASGATPHLIPVASRSNGYASAGMAFVTDEAGQIVRCRFPFTSDDDLAAMVSRVCHDGHGCPMDLTPDPFAELLADPGSEA